MDILFIFLGYLLGSIPFGFLLTRAAGLGDIRSIGSGNIGATNVLRTGNKGLAALTLLLDALKGALAVWLSFQSGDAEIILGTGLAAVAGHMYPVWLRFRGGKGVATALGALGMLMPLLGLAMIGIWLGVAVIFRRSSLAALSAFGASPVLALLWLGDEKLAVLCLILAVLIFWKHRGNIARLINGQEPRIGFGKNKI
ncbi:MAG: glycerol-3-phosphate 1-O-acyltransferase PlsY [Alphaproteobacteria bacterium]|nr:glycerol-3-phosphate 1-O-acyltransferase PlsY [Alphaproteobacteria bacterium]